MPSIMDRSVAFLSGRGFDTSEFISRWSEPQRVYHDTIHISNMLLSIDKINSEVDLSDLHVTLLHLFAWYHDIVYVPGAKDNELRSAELALERMPDTPVIANLVFRAVMATKTHTSCHNNVLIGYLLDCDLRGLGTKPAAYKWNSERVKAEYPGITEDQWLNGRKAFLEGFLARESIFFTWYGRPYEKQARINMQNELNEVNVALGC